MRHTLFTLIVVLLLAPQAVAQVNKAQDQQSTAEATSKTEKPKNEVDLLLEDLKNRGETVLAICVTEDCKGSKKIDGGVEAGRALHLGKPSYPPLARRAHVEGQVKVQVIIGEDGTVIAAAAVDGHPLLFGASVAAARESKFTPTRVNGKPVKVAGVLEYNFVAQ